MKYALYGIGIEAEYFLFQHPELDLEFCIDKYREEKLFHGIEVKRPDVIKGLGSEYLFVVAARNWNIYSEIRQELVNNYGLKEFDRFIWSKQFGRKLVLINANCHGIALEKYLNCLEGFEERFAIYPIEPVHENSVIDKDLLTRADIFIHQDIRENNQSGWYVSDTYTLSQIRKDCIDICIPNLVGMGGWMFPTTGGQSKMLKLFDGKEAWVMFRDEVLEKAYNIGLKSVPEIQDYWNDYKVENLQKLIERDFNKIKLRQKNWSIQIADYIFKNYKRIPCFVDHDHPSKYVMIEIGKQVAEIMGLELNYNGNYDVSLGLPLPILPSVCQYHSFSFEMEREIRAEYFGRQVKNELEDYIMAYMWWYHDCRVM